MFGLVSCLACLATVCTTCMYVVSFVVAYRRDSFYGFTQLAVASTRGVLHGSLRAVTHSQLTPRPCKRVRKLIPSVQNEGLAAFKCAEFAKTRVNATF